MRRGCQAAARRDSVSVCISVFDRKCDMFGEARNFQKANIPVFCVVVTTTTPKAIPEECGLRQNTTKQIKLSC